MLSQSAVPTEFLAGCLLYNPLPVVGAREAIEVILPLLLDKGLGSSVGEVRAFSRSVITHAACHV